MTARSQDVPDADAVVGRPERPFWKEDDRCLVAQAADGPQPTVERPEGLTAGRRVPDRSVGMSSYEPGLGNVADREFPDA